MPRAPCIYIGIDPGKSGGLVAIRPHNGSISADPMPKTLRDVWDWFQNFKVGCFCSIAILEKVRSSPQMGVTSSFTFGRGFGNLEALLVAAGISFQEVLPRTWQKELGIPGRKKKIVTKVVKVKGGKREKKRVSVYVESQPQFKQRLRDVAQRMFPNLPLWMEPRSKGKQLAIADALLIAEFCRRRNK